MKRNRPSRVPTVHRFALVCAVAVTLVASRSTAFNVPKASLSHRTIVQCQSAQVRRQALEPDAGFEFSLLARNDLVCPPVVCFQSHPRTEERLLSSRSDSYLHNRPPPLV